MRNALHFPLTDSAELFSPAIEKANYMKHYPFVNVHSADMVIFHCEQSTTRGPRSAIGYLDAIKAAKEAKTLPASYNQTQRVTVMSGGWIALTKAVNANPQTLERFRESRIEPWSSHARILLNRSDLGGRLSRQMGERWTSSENYERLPQREHQPQGY